MTQIIKAAFVIGGLFTGWAASAQSLPTLLPCPKDPASTSTMARPTLYATSSISTTNVLNVGTTRQEKRDLVAYLSSL